MGQIISSLQNPAIKNVLLLLEKPRERKSQNLIVIEGFREVSMAFKAGFNITALFYCHEFMFEPDPWNFFTHQASSFTTTEVTREVFNRMAYRKDSGGVIALAEPRKMMFNDLALRSCPLILVLEKVEKPGNLGAILRTADAGNLDAVIICDPQTDIYNPNAIRASLGTIFTVPVVTSTTELAISWLRLNKIKIYGTALTATQYYHEMQYRLPAAIIMGSEASGLSKTWLDEADFLIRIPMLGKVDSLNVSSSGAIVIFEALRQRNFIM